MSGWRIPGKGCKVMGSKKWDPSTDRAEGWGNYSWSKNGNAKKIHCHLEYLLNMSRLKKNDPNDQPLSQTFSPHSGRPRWYETSPHITDFVSKWGTKFWETHDRYVQEVVGKILWCTLQQLEIHPIYVYILYIYIICCIYIYPIIYPLYHHYSISLLYPQSTCCTTASPSRRGRTDAKTDSRWGDESMRTRRTRCVLGWDWKQWSCRSWSKWWCWWQLDEDWTFWRFHHWETRSFFFFCLNPEVNRWSATLVSWYRFLPQKLGLFGPWSASHSHDELPLAPARGRRIPSRKDRMNQTASG